MASMHEDSTPDLKVAERILLDELKVHPVYTYTDLSRIRNLSLMTDLALNFSSAAHLSVAQRFSQGSQTCCKSMRCGNPKGCPAGCSRHCRNTKENWKRWERWGCERKSTRQTKANGGGHWRCSVRELFIVQRVPTWGSGRNIGGGSCTKCSSQSNWRWIRRRCCSIGGITLITKVKWSLGILTKSLSKCTNMPSYSYNIVYI